MKLSVIPGSTGNDILCYKTLSCNYMRIHIEIRDEIINNEILIYYTDISAI